MQDSSGARPETDSGGETLEVERGEARGTWSLEVGSPEAWRHVPLTPDEPLTLGSGLGASVRIDDRTVSAAHCQVTLGRHGVVVRDLGSKNGLFIAGARVAEAVLTASGAAFVMGRTSVAARLCDPSRSSRPTTRIPGLVGDSAPMRQVIDEVLQAARCRAPVLIQGESGTGKDVVARALHQLSGRAGAYVPMNAAALPDSLADSELFGHCRGAFTGAVASRAGAFEQADKGTLFLDEVAELTPAVQVRLLRVVEDGQVRPLGGVRQTSVNVRLVSACWADLAERVAQGRFRADLYHRLSTLVITLPALRERRSDIPALCATLLQRAEGELGAKVLAPDALARLVEHGWPGNVRELGGVLYRAALRAPTTAIEAHHLVFKSPGKRREATSAFMSPADAHKLYELHGKNISAAARAAHVPRSTFRGWLERAAG